MSQINFRNILERKYTLPLLALFATFFSSPLIERYHFLYPLPVFIIMTIVMALLWLQRIDWKLFAFVGISGAVSFSLDVWWRYTHNQHFETMPPSVAIFVFIPAILFYISTIFIIIQQVFASKKVTTDTIGGGIFVYFLIAILWSRFYHFAAVLDHSAFRPELKLGDVFQVFYFSMVTLTTVGYGDIVPANRVTMVLSTLEAAFGQIYLAVFVARLIGLEMMHRTHNVEHK